LTKDALRSIARQQRLKLIEADPGASERLARHLLPHLPALMADRGLTGPIAGYRALADEIDPAPVLDGLHRAGMALCLPRVWGAARPLHFHRWQPGDPLQPGAYGIMEPAPTAACIDPVVLLVPLLAFDRHGHRLGYGGGYYDRTLAALSARGPLLSIGLAFRGQELLSLPHEAHDRSLDLIATDEGLLWPEPLAATLKDINF
jgi:5-formyltetrahydrofolate cyclo-ligase